MNESSFMSCLRSGIETAERYQNRRTQEFFAEKLWSYKPESLPAIATYARSLLDSGQHKRAYALLSGTYTAHQGKRTIPADRSAECRLIAALCLYRDKQYESCYKLVEEGEKIIFDDATPIIKSSLCLVFAKSLQRYDRQERATEQYKKALMFDCRCIEAMEALISCSLISGDDARALVNTLRYTDDLQWLKTYYDDYISASESPTSIVQPNVEDQMMDVSLLSPIATAVTPGSARMKHSRRRTVNESVQPTPRTEAIVVLDWSIDVLCNAAQRLYEQCRYTDCCALCETRIFSRDLLCVGAVGPYAGSLVHLKRAGDLYALSSRLVRGLPTHPWSWCVVGYYYICKGDVENARRHFYRASVLGPAHAPAWLGVAHSFLLSGDYDQALVSYRTAARLFPEHSEPLICSGTINIHLGNLSVGMKYLKEAVDVDSDHPRVWHELGTGYLTKGDVAPSISGDPHDCALYCFDRALSIALDTPMNQPGIDDYVTLLYSAHISLEDKLLGRGDDVYEWEPTLVMLGHCYRRLGMFDCAQFYYNCALKINNRCAETVLALGLTKHAVGDIDGAIALYHRVLTVSVPNNGNGGGDALGTIRKALREGNDLAGTVHKTILQWSGMDSNATWEMANALLTMAIENSTV